MITMHIPEGSNHIDLTKELTSARNIKDKNNRKQTIEGLLKMKQYI